MEKKKIDVRCEIVEKDGKKEIIAYGPVFDGKIWYLDEDEYICPQNISNLLKQCNGENVTVRLNSYGGDVFAGVAIYNLLKSHEGEVNIVIDGVACSSASIIAMAGNETRFGDGAMLMIHNPWTFTQGNAEELKDTARKLEKITDSLVSIYMKKFIGTEDELRKFLDDETYFTADEAINLGFGNAKEKNVQNKQKDDFKLSILEKYSKDSKNVETNNEWVFNFK